MSVYICVFIRFSRIYGWGNNKSMCYYFSLITLTEVDDVEYIVVLVMNWTVLWL